MLDRMRVQNCDLSELILTITRHDLALLRCIHNGLVDAPSLLKLSPPVGIDRVLGIAATSFSARAEHSVEKWQRRNVTYAPPWQPAISQSADRVLGAVAASSSVITGYTAEGLSRRDFAYTPLSQPFADKPSFDQYRRENPTIETLKHLERLASEWIGNPSPVYGLAWLYFTLNPDRDDLFEETLSVVDPALLSKIKEELGSPVKENYEVGTGELGGFLPRTRRELRPEAETSRYVQAYANHLAGDLLAYLRTARSMEAVGT